MSTDHFHCQSLYYLLMGFSNYQDIHSVYLDTARNIAMYFNAASPSCKLSKPVNTGP